MATEAEEKISATDLLREWAQALRGDWGGIDGRSSRRQLEQIADWIEHPEEMPEDAATAREETGLCPGGMQHWVWHCADDCTTITTTTKEN